MIPLTMVTGFLGTGKTTFLKKIAGKHADDRIVYLINEFSPQDMDGIQLEQTTSNVMTIPGGSIFCRCLAGQFIDHLTEIPKRFHHPGKPVTGVLIEASGVADPRVAARMLAESRLDKVYEFRRVVCLVDPGSVHKLLQTLPNMRAQMQSADTILINKTDCFDDVEVERTEQTVRALAPDAKVLRTAYCNVDIDIFGESGVMLMHGGDYAKCRDPDYERLLVECTQPVASDWLRDKIEALAPDIYRAKGRFSGQDGARKWLEHTSTGTTVKPDTNTVAAEPLRLTFILRPGSGDKLKAVVENLGHVVARD